MNRAAAESRAPSPAASQGLRSQKRGAPWGQHRWQKGHRQKRANSFLKKHKVLAEMPVIMSFSELYTVLFPVSTCT